MNSLVFLCSFKFAQRTGLSTGASPVETLQWRAFQSLKARAIRKRRKPFFPIRITHRASGKLYELQIRESPAESHTDRAKSLANIEMEYLWNMKEYEGI